MAGRRAGNSENGWPKGRHPEQTHCGFADGDSDRSRADQCSLGSEVFHGDAHALLMTIYPADDHLPIGLRMEAAKAALPYEKPRLASIENKTVDEFENMSDEEPEAWLEERAAARLKMGNRPSAEVQQRGGIGTPRPTTAQGKPH
jgi:hypothetical protein